MEQLNELRSKINSMSNNFTSYVKDLLSNIRDPVSRDDSVKKIKKMSNEMNHFLNGVERFCVMEHLENEVHQDISKQISDAREKINKLNSEVKTRHQQLQMMENELKSTNESLAKKVIQQQQQDKDIENKKKLLLSRERMLQLSIEKNVYNRKIIYTYIAIICFILILLFSAYYYYK